MISQERIEELWYSEKSNDELMALLGLTKWGFWKAKAAYRLPNRVAFSAHARPLKSRVDPDEETIAAMCLEFQRGWSDEERARRAAGIAH